MSFYLREVFYRVLPIKANNLGMISMPSVETKKINPTDTIIELIKDKFKDQAQNGQVATDAVSCIDEGINTRFDRLVSLKLDRMKSLEKDGKDPYSRDTGIRSKNSTETKENFNKESRQGIALIKYVEGVLVGKGIKGFDFDRFINTVSGKLDEVAEGIAKDQWKQEKASKKIETDKAVAKFKIVMRDLGIELPSTKLALSSQALFSGKKEETTRGGKQ